MAGNAVRVDEFIPKTDQEAVIIEFFTCLMRQDIDAFADMWTEDAIQDMPFAAAIEGLDPTWRGRETIIGNYRKIVSGRKDYVFRLESILQTADADCLVAEGRGRSIIVQTGREYSQRYVWIFKLNGKRVALFREYFNPLTWMRAFEGHLYHPGRGALLGSDKA